MNKIASNFLETLKAQISNTSSIAAFITSETYLGGKLFSFKGHEYQEYIVRLIESNPGAEVCLMKCSQVGASELIFRVFLAKMALRAGAAVLLSFPSKAMSSEIFKTRFDPIITESRRLRDLIDKNVNSASVKQMTNNSIAYALSGSPTSKSNLLSRPISDIIIDECDRQDPEIINSFGSRTTHTAEDKRLTVKISTPTIQGIGIDAEMATCRERHRPFTVCEHCGHEFDPDFYTHVKIPGYGQSLKLLSTKTAAFLDLDDSYLECPECLGNVAKRDYVWRIEHNENGVKKKLGVELNPFIAPSFITIPDLVKASLTFTSHVEFVNQKLGKVADLKESSINPGSIRYEHSDNLLGNYVYGLDMGKLCHLTIGVMRQDTSIHVTEQHIIKLEDLEEFMAQMNRRIIFTAGVIDSMPYADMVYRFIRAYQRLYSAIYVSPVPPMPELYKITKHDKDGNMVRQLNINKNAMMDLMVNDLEHFFTFEPSPMEGIVKSHLGDMRRVRDYRFDEPLYCWIKSAKGEDHFFHSLVYMYSASKLVAAGLNATYPIPITIKKMRHK